MNNSLLFVKRLRKLKYLKKFCTSTQAAEAGISEYSGHTPVMSKEILSAFLPQDDQVFMDMTFGGGGHSRHLLNSAAIKLYCMDRDPAAFEKAKQLSKEFGDSVTPLLGKFSEMPTVLLNLNVQPNSLDGILIDAGCSSMQLDNGLRGFSISNNGVLDMRMDGNRFPDQPTAHEVLNSLDVPSLAKVFKVYGEEKYAKKIAQSLFNARYMLSSINTTHELADLIQSTLVGVQRFDKLQRPTHVATKVFQALRIFVNDELNELHYGIDMAHRYLKPGGKLAVLTFHSLEDRVVKRQIMGIDINEPVSHSLGQKYKNSNVWHTKAFVDEITAKKWQPLTKHVVKPSVEETEENPRSRSAKLRVAKKLAVES